MYPKALVFLVLLNLCTNVLSHVSGITFENGQYTNILIGLSDDLDASNCKSIIDNIKINLQELSTKLHSATDSKSSIGSVDILFPSSWRNSQVLSECGLTDSGISKEIKVFQSYKTADIKITEKHPISNQFPWAKQYKPCGNASEAIYISPAFLNTTTWSAKRKGNILLHEWAKFRYGVFEEFGFYDDELYSPCYTKGGKWHFTTCSDEVLDAIHSSSTESINCKSEVSSNNNVISARLNASSSSIMGSPHLSNVAGFCSASNHNIFAPTKHNSLCGRKSVNEVVMSHRDFSGFAKSTLQTPTTIVTRFLHRDLTANPRSQGYAFVIEDSPKIREHDRLRVIKQSITQMVDLMPMSGTEVVRISFNETDAEVGNFYGITSENQKVAFLETVVPDRNTPMLTQSELKGEKHLGSVFGTVVSTLNGRQYEYNIIYIVSQTSTATEFTEAIETVKSSRHTLTIVSFDDSDEWLVWNSIPNTKKLLYFPTCTESLQRILCNAKLASLLTDSLLETLGYSQNRYIHKVAELQINFPRQTFSIPNTFDESTNLVVVLPIFGDADVENLIHFVPPFPLNDNDTCAAKKMLRYSFVVQMDTSQPNCKLRGGQWSVVINENFVDSGSHMLLVYLETKGSTSDLTVTTGMGHYLEDTLDPSTGLTPVYATVSSSSDLPVIGAKVTLDLFSGAPLVPTTLTLKDDGLYPDNTKGDGVYSTILKGFSRNPATHLGQIHVNTNASANVIMSLPDIGNAALIDSHSTLFSRKCCGSSVTVQTSGLGPVGESSYSVFIPSFKTSANSDPSQIPPSKIESVKIISADDNSVKLQFNAPGENYDIGIVAGYEICCYPEENQPTLQCKAIPKQDCDPVDVGEVQTCNIYEKLVKEMDYPDDTLSWICGIRGVNSANIAGEVSATIVEIQFSSGSSGSDTKCESIADGCLPIWIFWVLIGCVAALTLLVLILIICWCCVSRRNQTQQTPKKTFEKNKKKTGKIPDKDSPLYNVYVNQAYIQDSDGQLKLVASDGELLPYDTKTNERGDDLGYATQNSGPQTPVLNSQRVPKVRRRSLSANAKEQENVSSFKPVDNSRKHVSWNQENNTPVFKVMKDEDYDIDYSVMNFDKPNLGRNLSKSEEFITVTPKAKDRQPKSMVGYANPMIINNANKNNETKMTPVPSITSTVDTYNRNDWLNSNIDDDNRSGPIYASVNRNGHRGVGNGKPVVPPSYGGYDPNHVHSAAPTVPPSRESVTLKNAWNPLGAGRFNRGINNRNNRSMRLDAFPSSESETYSDISRGIPVPPPPPPLPTAADLKRTSAYQVPSKIPQKRSSSDDSDTMTEGNSTIYAQNIPKPAVTVSRSPPKDKSFAGIRSHIEQQLNNRYSNPNPKPLPPPRQDKYPVSSVSNASSFGSRVVEMGEIDDEDYYDEDSDCWDDGDDMEEYNPGHSFA